MSSRLMAELAYGSGLRLLELLRLRVHHLDLERQRLQVFGGKGDKDRVTVLPEKLVPGRGAALTTPEQVAAHWDAISDQTGQHLYETGGPQVMKFVGKAASAAGVS